VRAWAGLKKGVGARGRASWPRIPATCASARVLVHSERGEGRADRGGPRRRERERASAQGNDSASGRAGPQGREGRGARGRRNWHRQLGPTGQRARERERRVRERELPLTSGSHLSGGAGARAHGLSGPSWAGWAALAFSFSLDFLFAFPFLFL
jgi:hypothetical protein